MVERFVDRPGVDVELAHVEHEGGAVRDALRLDLAGLVAVIAERLARRGVVSALPSVTLPGSFWSVRLGADVEAGPHARASW